MKSERYQQRDLTAPQRRGLVLLLEGAATREPGSQQRGRIWVSKSRDCIQHSTIESLYDRYLVKLVFEAGPRRIYRAILTDVGQYAAAEIKRQEQFSLSRRSVVTGLSDESAYFIAALFS